MSPELGQTLCRLTEAGMWFRMHMDLEKVPLEAMALVREKKMIQEKAEILSDMQRKCEADGNECHAV